nr:hydantoinase/oxoprolinase family protein [Candidatus Baldrarchaeota archaeon]
MVYVAGFDIGGANTKVSLVKVENGILREIQTAKKYFPIWKAGKDKLVNILREITDEVMHGVKLEAVGVTITAELSDAYWCKREGINHVLDCVEKIFKNLPIYVLNCDGGLLTVEEARKEFLKVAAANWAATAWMISRIMKNCIVIDVGSTTTSIIPILEGKCAASGKTDLEKLMCGELVYTGSLRTNVAAIVDKIPIRGNYARVSSELFALSGDVHLILGNIREEDYTTETADGRGKTRLEAMARLARVVCADIEMLGEEEIEDMARYIYDKQIDQIAEGLRQVYSRLKPEIREEIPVVTVGLGGEFLAKRAAERVGFKKIISLEDFLGVDASIIAPAVGVALMVADKLVGLKDIKIWELNTSKG